MEKLINITWCSSATRADKTRSLFLHLQTNLGLLSLRLEKFIDIFGPEGFELPGVIMHLAERTKLNKPGDATEIIEPVLTEEQLVDFNYYKQAYRVFCFVKAFELVDPDKRDELAEGFYQIFKNKNFNALKTDDQLTLYRYCVNFDDATYLPPKTHEIVEEDVKFILENTPDEIKLIYEVD